MVPVLPPDPCRRTGAGTLPPNRDYVAQGGVSHGEMCDWCGEDLAPQFAMIEIIWINPGPVLATAFLHPACYEAWRSAQRSSSDPS